MKIAETEKFKVYIYPDDHPPPHCHVRYKGGLDISVDMPLIEPRYNARITKDVYDIISLNLENLCSAWERLNPNKLSKQKKTQGK